MCKIFGEVTKEMTNFDFCIEPPVPVTKYEKIRVCEESDRLVLRIEAYVIAEINKSGKITVFSGDRGQVNITEEETRDIYNWGKGHEFQIRRKGCC